MRSLIVALLATLLLIAAGTQVEAQVRVRGFDGLGYESYFFQDPEQSGIDRLSLLVLSFGVEADLPLGSTLQLIGDLARGELVGADGEVRSIRGANDIQLSLEVPVVGPLSVGAIGVLPTGKYALSEEEAVVAGAIAADLLPFRITNWGSGGGYGMTGRLAHSFGGLGLGVSALYLFTREFDALQSLSAAYRPGDQLRVQIAADADIGLTSRASLRLSYHGSEEDQLGGLNLYRAGDRYQAMGAFSFPAGSRGAALAYAGVLHRTEGARLLELSSGPTPAEDLLFLGGSLRLPFGRGILAPTSDLRLYRNEAGLGQGYAAGLGASLEWPFAGIVAAPSVRGRLGKVELREGQESSFLGIDLGVSMRFGGRAR